ncbi:MAG: electron transfer flavoprotein subunit beta/FixA family protein, partial [Lachnospiraceae bacterium]|nr:electron transfer flavoprotein subunit beta/FixA family protein [Lachnospiraceae bacterium]
TSNVEVDPVTGVLKRENVAGKLNPYDLFALEAAFRIIEKKGGTVRTLSMGPNQAMASLRETLAMGADSAVLLSDRKFAGSDVQATSYAIQSGIRKMGGFDLILCGKQTTDGDTAQVGPEVAEMLGIEHATNVMEIGEITDESITVTFSLDDVLQTERMALPCLITLEKDAFTPRLPSFRRMKEIREEQITVLTAADLEGLDEKRCGLKGSPTQVEKIFPPAKNEDKELFRGTSDELTDTLFDLLKSKKFI